METTHLAGYTLALHICGKLFQDAPSEIFLARSHEQNLFSEWPLPPASEEAAAALDALQRAFQTGPGDAEAVRQDAFALFSGPAPIARPWESVWREGENILFGEQTMLVRQTYAQWGLVSETRGREPEDHLALELAFCVHLLHRIAQDDRNAGAALADFLDSHLLRWAEPCLRKASENATEVLYRALTLLCLDALHSLRKDLY